MFEEGLEVTYESQVTVSVASAHSDSQWEFHGVVSIIKSNGHLILKKNNGNIIEISDNYLFIEITI